MKYREMIKNVQTYSGFSDAESKDALDATVAILAVHLTEGERKDFASQLPVELQDIALAVWATEENVNQDILNQFAEIQHIDQNRAKRQLLSSWKAISDAVSSGQIKHVLAQLPRRTTMLLNF